MARDTARPRDTASTRETAAGQARAKPSRRRRTAQEARRVILDAARQRLMDGGPEALRLQEIAADVGISHPAILHHFTSREGLVQALVERDTRELNAELLRSIEHPDSLPEPHDVLDRLFDTLSDTGTARLLAWRNLTRREPSPDDEQQLRQLTDAVHRRTREHAQQQGVAAPSYEEAEFCMRLATVAMFGDAILGADLNASSGSTPDAQRRFRRWLGRLLEARLTP